MNGAISMNEIKRGVEMAVRIPMMKLPKIPFSDMYLKDLWELEVEDPEDFSRRVGAVRSAHKRWAEQNEDDPRKFFIGKSQYTEGCVAVYCYEGPSKDEANQSVQPTGTHSTGFIS
tara:strand:- start:2133 stop:2480 length:348 start_codon:yes stop_codon:yes gene_type:complete